MSKLHPEIFKAEKKQPPSYKQNLIIIYTKTDPGNTGTRRRGTDTLEHKNISQWCSSHLRDLQNTPPQSLIPAASVSSFPLSSPSPAACEQWPTNRQGCSKCIVPFEYIFEKCTIERVKCTVYNMALLALQISFSSCAFVNILLLSMLYSGHGLGSAVKSLDIIVVSH